ncbi:glycosyl hydrolase family 65 protein [Kitasatospora sp. NPDC049258]|uniref:glycoside hydrolase family 65 protein n=1 Tax=Kitasatospora sp. NPDC049258 TaxID=3155394 RepID=UPI00341F03A6
MIDHRAYPVDPWCLRENALHLEVLAQSESLFALSNGHLGWRGTLDEGEPAGLPGSYLNGVFERVPGGAGEPGRRVADIPDGRLVRLMVDDEPFDLRYGRLHRHHRTLDLRTGVLERAVEWSSPSGRTVRIASSRLVSLSQRAIGALSYRVEPVDGPARVVLQSELLAGSPALEPEAAEAAGTRLHLMHRTRQSGQRIGVAAEHTVAGPDGTATAVESGPELARLTVTSALRAGQSLGLEKLVAHGWSAVRSRHAVRSQLDAALARATATGWAGLVAEQRQVLAAFWNKADVELEGDAEIQQAVRFALFQLYQAAARAEQRAVAAKGLTGPGHDGHCFWDTETHVLPVLTYTAPQLVAQALRWRHSTLPAARRRARALGLEGAAFPARTIDGEECATHLPADASAFHVNAGVADALAHYTAATDDLVLDREAGLELLVHTARLWRSLGHHDPAGTFHLDGVSGPDEYSGDADDNLYTNLMAQQNLRAAADAAERNADLAVALGVSDEETAAWRDAALHLAVPFDERLGVHEQSAGFTRHQVWDFAGTGPGEYPLLRHHPYFQLRRRQVVQQPDLVLALYRRGEAFGPEQKARDFAYYEALTVRDSPIAAGVQAVLAAETGHLALAYDYLAETALLDLDGTVHDLRDGLRLAALAGVWLALVAGFGGLRHHGDTLAFAPRLPAQLARLAFTVQFQRRVLRVETTAAETRYSLLEGAELQLWHHGEPLTVARDEPAVRPVPPLPDRPAPTQPAGRRPRHRRRSEDRARTEE